MSYKVNGSIGLPGQILTSSGTTDIVTAWNDFDLVFHGSSLSYKKVVRLASIADVGASIISTESVAVTGASGTGLLATLTFATQEYVPFLVGSTITVASVVPAGYNATAIVVQCTTTSVKYYNTTTTAWTSGGTITAANTIMIGYTPNQSLACTTTAASTTVTTTQTLGLRANYAVSTPTVQLAGGTTVASTSNGTTFVVNNRANIAITSISGNGATVTAIFAHQTFVPYAVGASIVVSGTTNYNATWVVTACTNTSVSWSSALTATEATGTIAFTIAAGTSITTAWANAQPCTTTAGSNNVTVVSTSNIKVGSTVTNATVQIAAGTTVASITSATVLVLNARANITTTAISTTANVATATFAAQTYVPFAVGSSITIAGTTPVGYSGTFVVTACTTTTVSWSSVEPGPATVQGTISFTVAAGTSIITPFLQSVVALSVDAVAVANGDRILLKDQSTLGGFVAADNAKYNGIYTVQYTGTTALPWVLIRSPDADSATDLDSAIVNVSVGTANYGKSYKTRFAGTSTLNTTRMFWGRVVDVQSSSFSSAPTTAVGVDLTSDTETVLYETGNVANYAGNSLGIKTLTTVGASTYTTASSLYIAGAPVASTNVTVTNPFSLFSASGAVGILADGTLNTAGDSVTTGMIISGQTRAFNTASNPATLNVHSNSTLAADAGGTIGLGGRYTGTQYAQFAIIKGAKENATDNNYASYLAFGTRANGANITEKVRIDSAGNVGIGGAPTSGWTVNNAGTLQIKSAAFSGLGTYDPHVSSNCYWNGTNWIYIASSVAASNYYQSAGSHIWREAAAGTAGGTITWTTSMSIDANNNLNITGNLGVKDAAPGTDRAINSAITLSSNQANHGLVQTLTGDTTALTATRSHYAGYFVNTTNLQNATSFSSIDYGVFARAINIATSGNSVDGYGYLIGVHGEAYNISTDATYKRVENLWGVRGQAYVQSASAISDSVIGVYSSIGSLTAGGTVTNAYMFYGDLTATGTVTNRYGIYISTAVNNYLNGGLQIGGTAPTGTGTTGLGIGKAAPGAAGVADALTGFRINGAATAGNYLRGDGTNFVANTIQAGDLPSHTHLYAGSASAGGPANSVASSITFNNGGAGAASGTTFNGSAAVTVSHNTLGALALTGGTLTGQFITTDTWDAASGGGAIYLNNTAGNRIDFNTNGVAAPAFTTRSIGTKIVLYPNISATATDFALGIENNTLWYSIPTAGSTYYHKWYAATTNVMDLGGTGDLTVRSTAQGTTGISALQGTNYVSLKPNLSAGGYNPLVAAGNQGIIFSTGTQNAGTLVIGPWSSVNAGLKMTAAGRTDFYTTNGYCYLDTPNTTYTHIGTDRSLFYMTTSLDINGSLYCYNGGSRDTYLTPGILQLRSISPTINLRDTDHRSSFVHCNSNIFYVLGSTTVDATTWTAVNGGWPMYVDLTTNNAQFITISAAGNITAYSSDKRLKTNIKEIPNAIDKIKQIRGVTFDWIDEVESLGFFPQRKIDDIGVIAQEVEKVLPQVVAPAPFDTWVPDPSVEYTDEELEARKGTSKSGENYVTVQYDRIVPLLIQGIKEQQDMIEELKREINILKQKIGE